MRLPDDDKRELIDGKLIEVEVPSKLHEYIQLRVGGALAQWGELHEAGYALGPGYKIKVTAHQGVMPDIQFYRNENPTKGSDLGLARGHPDLAVEIVSPSSQRYDRVVKLNWYAKIGVPEYWIISPEAHTIERLVLRGAHYVIMETAEEKAVFRPSSFPGLAIPLSGLWVVSSPKKRKRRHS